MVILLDQGEIINLRRGFRMHMIVHNLYEVKNNLNLIIRGQDFIKYK
jgi:hypothetical protein